MVYESNGHCQDCGREFKTDEYPPMGNGEILDCQFCERYICREFCIDRHGFRCINVYRKIEELGGKIK